MGTGKRESQVVYIHFDGDVRIEESMCNWYCKPTCHPANVGEEDVFGCSNPSHHTYIKGDFVPIVNCGGEPENCDIALCRAEILLKEISIGY